MTVETDKLSTTVSIELPQFAISLCLCYSIPLVSELVLKLTYRSFNSTILKSSLNCFKYNDF